MALMVLPILLSVSIVVQKYYSFTAACRCKEHEIKHICRYHGRQAEERELESSKDKVSSNETFSPPLKTSPASRDIYIEVSPGTYSVTATSEDMVRQTHVVDVNAGQSIDLTFVL
ncbi:AKIP1 protein, partial [Steatornis caripensis]|nr:AKIP1 protein [Steatornis caripensis]